MINETHIEHERLGGTNCQVCSINIDNSFSRDFENYLDAIIAIRKEALKQLLEERSIKVNSLHRGTKE